MPREKDSRDFKRPRLDKALQPTANLAFESVAGQNIEAARVNPISGSLAAVKVNDASGSAGSLIDRALEFMQGDSRAAAGFGPKDKSDFVPDPHVQYTKGGTAIVHLHQRYRGIPVFQMSRSVQFSAGQQIDRIVGDSTTITQEIDIIPKIDAAFAVLVAARYWHRPTPPNRSSITGEGPPRRHNSQFRQTISRRFSPGLTVPASPPPSLKVRLAMKSKPASHSSIRVNRCGSPGDSWSPCPNTKASI